MSSVPKFWTHRNKQIDNKEDQNLRLKKIIDQILAEKKANELKNEKIINVENNTSKVTDNKILKNNEEHKINSSSKFMTHSQRESALADLIIDMELYHINNFKNQWIKFL